jgi:hypothetical protein
MIVPERDDACVISCNPPTLSLDELATFTTFLNDLYALVAAPWVAQELDESIRGVRFLVLRKSLTFAWNHLLRFS